MTSARRLSMARQMTRRPMKLFHQARFCRRCDPTSLGPSVSRPDAARCVRFSRWNSSLRPMGRIPQLAPIPTIFHQSHYCQDIPQVAGTLTPEGPVQLDVLCPSLSVSCLKFTPIPGSINPIRIDTVRYFHIPT